MIELVQTILWGREVKKFNWYIVWMDERRLVVTTIIYNNSLKIGGAFLTFPLVYMLLWNIRRLHLYCFVTIIFHVMPNCTWDQFIDEWELLEVLWHVVHLQFFFVGWYTKMRRTRKLCLTNAKFLKSSTQTAGIVCRLDLLLNLSQDLLIYF